MHPVSWFLCSLKIFLCLDRCLFAWRSWLQVWSYGLPDWEFFAASSSAQFIHCSPAQNPLPCCEAPFQVLSQRLLQNQCVHIYIRLAFQRPLWLQPLLLLWSFCLLLPRHCSDSLHTVLSQDFRRPLDIPPVCIVSSMICSFNWSSAFVGPQLQLLNLPVLLHLSLCSRIIFQMLIASCSCCFFPALFYRFCSSFLLVWPKIDFTTTLLHRSKSFSGHPSIFLLPDFLSVQAVKKFHLQRYAHPSFDSLIFCHPLDIQDRLCSKIAATSSASASALGDWMVSFAAVIFAFYRWPSSSTSTHTALAHLSAAINDNAHDVTRDDTTVDAALLLFLFFCWVSFCMDMLVGQA